MAIISRARGLIFLHVSKTGGTSIAGALAPLADVEVPGERMHLTLDGCLDYLSEREISAFRKVMVVRNSWDRVASAYWHHLRAPLLDPGVYRDIRRSGLARFVRCHAMAGWASQTRWLYFKGEKAPVEIIRYENLIPEFGSFCQSIGFERDLPQLNVTEGRPGVNEIYTERSRALVASIFCDEISEFGFTPPRAVPAPERDRVCEPLRRRLVAASDLHLSRTKGNS